MNVAVTGVGGGVGQSVLKALSISTLPITVFPVDVTSLSAGIFRSPNSKVLPKPEDADALSVWENWLRKNGIDALIPGSDHDLRPLASVRDDWNKNGVTRVLVSDLALIDICGDKAQTYLKLKSAGFPVPDSAWALTLDEAVTWSNSTGYPIIVKPRDGYASRHLHIAHDDEELRFYYNRTPNPILQEYLQHSGKIDEFTCTVFVDRNGDPTGTFMARRDLSGGATYRAEINFWPDIHELLIAIGKALRPRGPLNVQLRQTDRGPVPFELNIRCSGTSAIRAYYGFNEPEMLLRHYILNQPLEVPKPRTGFVLRYWNELFLEGVDEQALKSGIDGLQGEILAWP